MYLNLSLESFVRSGSSFIMTITCGGLKAFMCESYFELISKPSFTCSKKSYCRNSPFDFGTSTIKIRVVILYACAMSVTRPTLRI